MASAGPQIFNNQKLPRPLCPRVVETGKYMCDCGFHFENYYSLAVHRTEDSRITTHVRPSLSLRNLHRPLILSRPSPSQLLVGSARHSCSSCGKAFATGQGLRQHEGKVHVQRQKNSKCPVCGQKYATKYAVKFHIEQVHHSSQRVYCEFCELPFYNKYVYQKHVHKCQERIKLRDAYCNKDL